MSKAPSEPDLNELWSGLTIWSRNRLAGLHSAGYTPYLAGGITLLLLLFLWSRPTTSASIARVIAEDKRISREELGTLGSGASASERAAAIRRYCARADKQSMGDCPPRFQVIYKEHVRAWGQASNVVDALPDGLIDGLWTGFINSITRGEMDGGLSRMETSLAQEGKRIQDTWHEVIMMAAEHGVAPSD